MCKLAVTFLALAAAGAATPVTFSMPSTTFDYGAAVFTFGPFSDALDMEVSPLSPPNSRQPFDIPVTIELSTLDTSGSSDIDFSLTVNDTVYQVPMELDYSYAGGEGLGFGLIILPYPGYTYPETLNVATIDELVDGYPIGIIASHAFGFTQVRTNDQVITFTAEVLGPTTIP
jgi:hypothetical protein